MGDQKYFCTKYRVLEGVDVSEICVVWDGLFVVVLWMLDEVLTV